MDQSIPSFLTPGFWQHLIRALGFSPQQARIVSLILRGKQDKAIALELGVSRYTVRCYLRRIFDREGLEDRMALVLRVFELYAAYRVASDESRSLGKVIVALPSDPPTEYLIAP